jgi:hypothetical protein
MAPARGEWNSTLKRAAGERGRRRRLRMARPAPIEPPKDRKAVLAALLARKK